jgi:hypothetical protein
MPGVCYNGKPSFRGSAGPPVSAAANEESPADRCGDARWCCDLLTAYRAESPVITSDFHINQMLCDFYPIPADVLLILSP